MIKRHFLNKSIVTVIMVALFLIVLLWGILLCTPIVKKNINDNWSVAFVSQRDKETWREPLIELLSKMDSHGSYIETRPDEEDRGDRYDYFPGGYGIALFDFNLDGIPEVVEVYPGGSGGLGSGRIYDLYSGNEVGGISMNEDDWCVYYNELSH